MPDPRRVATVSAGGQKLTAFETITVRRDFADGISFVEFTPTESARSIRLGPGDPLTVTLGGVKVLTGFVSTRSVALDAENHQIVIGGRSLSGDVFDSSVDIKPGTFDNSTFHQIANAVCQPHGVKVSLINPPAIASKPFATMRLQPGETGAELLGRLAAARGMFLSDDANGNVVAHCGKPGAAPIAELQEGRNIKSLSGVIEDQSAFGKFAAISQMPSPHGDYPARWNSTSATVNGVRQNRSRLIIAEHPLPTDELVARNGIEVAQALWQSLQLSVKVTTWFDSTGKLWTPRENVSVYSPSFFPSGINWVTLGIQAVIFGQSTAEGTTATLNLTRPEALTSIPTKGLTDTGGADESPGFTNGGTPQSRPDTPDYMV